ncbi:MAG TPA: SDR family NAD(P)-dependent oxidoreductase [Vicinamibacterales bacterium]|nr:SDR family NAD(P)-dependent oxidoreductase [Vicinamibacterales bacterium]
MNAAIVTGAGGGGCGRSIARRLARDGATVVVSDVHEPGGVETVRLIREDGGRASFVPADVRDEAQLSGLVDAAARLGDLQILVNNASAPQPTADGIAGWTNVIATDFLGAMHATRYAVEAMRRAGGGSIVNITSISALWQGRTTPGGFNGYDVAKMALIRMTTVLAPDLAKDGIRINCLAPGWIATDGPRQYWESLSPEERKARGVPATLLAPEQVADIVARIASDRALNGRIVVWWSEDRPRLVRWGDRGYAGFDSYSET